MAVDFQAFASEIVLDSFQKKIEAIEAFQDGVAAGLSDGTLVLFRPNSEDAAARWQMYQAHRNICKRHAAQLQVIKLLSVTSLHISLNNNSSIMYRCTAASGMRYLQRTSGQTCTTCMYPQTRRSCSKCCPPVHSYKSLL